MGEIIVEKREVLPVCFVCATAVQSQLLSFADFFSYSMIAAVFTHPVYSRNPAYN